MMAPPPNSWTIFSLINGKEHDFRDGLINIMTCEILSPAFPLTLEVTILLFFNSRYFVPLMVVSLSFIKSEALKPLLRYGSVIKRVPSLRPSETLYVSIVLADIFSQYRNSFRSFLGNW